jgi:hypothetical protein
MRVMNAINKACDSLDGILRLQHPSLADQSLAMLARAYGIYFLRSHYSLIHQYTGASAQPDEYLALLSQVGDKENQARAFWCQSNRKAIAHGRARIVRDQFLRLVSHLV